MTLAAFATPIKVTLAVSASLVVGALGFFSWQQFYPVSAAPGWTVRVAYDDVKKAAALGLDVNGAVLVTEELRNRQGRLLQIGADGSRTTLADELSKPDGLASFQGRLVFSQEGGEHPVISLHNGVMTPLFSGINVQGLKADGDLLYAVEDRKGEGRLLRYQASDQSVSVLREHLDEAEAFEICPNRQMFYTEKAKGVVRRLSEDGSDPVLLDGLKEPSFLLCDARGLWITEDRTHLARLLLLDSSGELRVILSFLKAPQELLPVGEGKYLLAEGGRNRVLEVSVAN